MSTDELFHQAMALPVTQRAALARDLIASLEEETCEPDIEEAWSDEVNRRADAYAADQTSALNWRESIARIRSDLKQARRP